MKYYLITEDAHALTGLRLAGVEGELVESAAQAEKAVQSAEQDSAIAVILITPKAAAWIPATVERLKISGERPLLAVIPASDGAGIGPDVIMGMIRQAIGVKL